MSEANEAVTNIAAEKEVLGSLMVTISKRVQAVQVDTGLKASHFYLDRHQAIFEAISRVIENGSASPDELLVKAELERAGQLDQVGANYPSELCATVAAPGNVLHHAKLVIEAADWRSKQLAAYKILEGVGERDRAKLGEAEAMLNQEVVHTGATYDEAAMMRVAEDLLTGERPEAFPWPIPRLNELCFGGYRRGTFTVLGGHTSHGKSVILDQTVELAADAGNRTHLYMNEMTVQERVARALARETQVPYSRIIQQNMSEAQVTAVRAAQSTIAKYGITDCPDWSAEEICQHIRLNRWDVAGVDILHMIAYEDTKDLERIANTFARTAKSTNCAIIATVHLNRARIKTAKVPRPTHADIKGASAFEQAADSCVFVHRDQNDAGIPKATGRVYFTKARNAQLGEARVVLNGERYTFEPDNGKPLNTPHDEPAPGGQMEMAPVPAYTDDDIPF